jgi:hypothetical protein
MAVMRFWLVHFQESSSWEPLNGFECNLVWMFLWRSLSSFDSLGPFTNFKMTTCEGQHFIETVWKTIFSSSSRETPNRILPNLAHLLILCVFTSVLCGVNKEVEENNNNKNQIHSWPFLYKPGEHRQQSKG